MRYPHFIRIERPRLVADGGGGQHGVWVVHAEEPGRIERVRSIRQDIERVGARGREAGLICRIHMAKHPLIEEVRTDWRMVEVDTGICFAVNSMQDLTGQGREITFTVIEGDPA